MKPRLADAAVVILLSVANFGLAHAQGCRFDCSTQLAQSNQGVQNNGPAVNRGTPPIRLRFGVPIPTCPIGMGYSIEHQQCIPATALGGVIPCSEDDKQFIPGRGLVYNCR